MRVIKSLLIAIIIYFIFIFLVFVSVDSPKNLEDINLIFDSQKPAIIKLEHLLPDVKYQVFLYLDKKNHGEFFVKDKKGKIIFKTKDEFNETIPIKIKDIVNQKEVIFYFNELSPPKTQEEINNEKERIKLKTDFYNQLWLYLKDGDYQSFFKGMENFFAGQIPGYEKIPSPIVKKPSTIKQLIARPNKDFNFFLVINKIILASYIRYFNKDIPFRIFYLFLISLIIWQILKVKKEIS